MKLFGPGVGFIQRTDVPGSTPLALPPINEFSLSAKASLKELFGSFDMPIAVARGTRKVTGKLKFATLSGQAWSAMDLGQDWTTGTQYDVFSTPATPIPATPFKITPILPSSGTWVDDLGVVNAANSQPFELVASSPTAGQYSVAAGVYTFSTADEASGISVVISQSYSFTTAPGQSLEWESKLIGDTPTFRLVYKSVNSGQVFYIEMFNAASAGVDLGFKLEDFAMPEMDVSFFANDATPPAIGRISLADQL